eukprot:6206470-Pleurochrysis_carterae.AAC.5
MAASACTQALAHAPVCASLLWAYGPEQASACARTKVCVGTCATTQAGRYMRAATCVHLTTSLPASAAEHALVAHAMLC